MWSILFEIETRIFWKVEISYFPGYCVACYDQSGCVTVIDYWEHNFFSFVTAFAPSVNNSCYFVPLKRSTALKAGFADISPERVHPSRLVSFRRLSESPPEHLFKAIANRPAILHFYGCLDHQRMHREFNALTLAGWFVLRLNPKGGGKRDKLTLCRAWIFRDPSAFTSFWAYARGWLV